MLLRVTIPPRGISLTTFYMRPTRDAVALLKLQFRLAESLLQQKGSFELEAVELLQFRPAESLLQLKSIFKGLEVINGVLQFRLAESLLQLQRTSYSQIIFLVTIPPYGISFTTVEEKKIVQYYCTVTIPPRGISLTTTQGYNHPWPYYVGVTIPPCGISLTTVYDRKEGKR